MLSVSYSAKKLQYCFFLEQGINEKILSFDYTNHKAEINTADAQKSYQEGVTVLVTGCLTGKDNLKRKFAQSFFLAPQDNGYFVLNDVLRYVGDSEPLEKHKVNGVNDAPRVPPTPEPGKATLFSYFLCRMFKSMFVFIIHLILFQSLLKFRSLLHRSQLLLSWKRIKMLLRKFMSLQTRKNSLSMKQRRLWNPSLIQTVMILL